MDDERADLAVRRQDLAVGYGQLVLGGNGNAALGIGEAAQGPTAAAIGNAVYDALGVRVRTLPFTEEHILAAMPD